MFELTPKERFIESLDRCSLDEAFIPAFYQRFLAQDDEIREKFRNTDFEQQNQMLIRSLRLAADATAGLPESLREIRERAESHDRDHMNIKPHLYALWLNSVIETASEFDTEWDETIHSAWETILGYVVEHMIRFY